VNLLRSIGYLLFFKHLSLKCPLSGTSLSSLETKIVIDGPRFNPWCEIN
jgi:hypothetical protein